MHGSLELALQPEGSFLNRPVRTACTRGTSSACEFVSVKLLFLTNALPERTNIVLIDINGPGTPLPIVLGEFEDYGMNEVSQTGEGIKHGLLRPLGTLHPMPGNVLLHNYDHHPAVWRLCGVLFGSIYDLEPTSVIERNDEPFITKPVLCVSPFSRKFCESILGTGTSVSNPPRNQSLHHQKRQTRDLVFFPSTYPDPFIHRLASLGALIGGLPFGASPERKNLTWVPVRAYTPEQVGLTPPQGAPREVRSTCECCTSTANLAPTDVPVLGGGGYLYSWSLGGSIPERASDPSGGQ
jgi:hypothetical protein